MEKKKEERETLFAYLQSIGVNIEALKEIKISDAALEDLVTGLRKLLASYGPKRDRNLLALGFATAINGLMVSVFL
jgi:hypothetical protein